MPGTVLDNFVVNFLFYGDLTALDRIQSRVTAVQRGFTKVGKGMTIAGLAMTYIVGKTAQAAISWEDSFAGVRKTVEATDEEFAILENQLRHMASTEMPISHEEIAQIAENAGQLGIEKDNVVDFTRIMAMLAATTDLTADSASFMTAQFANVTGMKPRDYARFGATLVDLGNNSAATESAILGLSQRIAGVGKAMGLTQDQILGFGAAVVSVGVNEELGGTAINQMMLKMLKSVEQGGDQLRAFSEVAGMSADEFSRVYKDDATQAFNFFLRGIDRLKKTGAPITALLDDMNIKGTRQQQVVFNMAERYDKFQDSLERARKAWEENAALEEEFRKRQATLQSQLTLFRNSLKDVAISLGQSFTPSIQRLLDWMNPLIEQFKEFVEGPEEVRKGVRALTKDEQVMIEANRELVQTFGFTGMAIGALGLAFIGFGWILGAALSAFTAYGTVIAWFAPLMAGAVKLITAAIAANPIGAALAGIALAITLWWQYSEEIGHVADDLVESFTQIGDMDIARSADRWKEIGEDWEWLSDAWNALMAGMGQAWNALMAGMGQAWDAFFAGIKNALNAFVAGLKELLPEFVVKALFESEVPEKPPEGSVTMGRMTQVSPPPEIPAPPSAPPVPGVTQPLPVGPSPSASLAGLGGQQGLAGANFGPRTQTVNIEKIEITASSANSQELAKNFKKELQKELTIANDNADSQLAY